MHELHFVVIYACLKNETKEATIKKNKRGYILYDRILLVSALRYLALIELAYRTRVITESIMSTS